MARAKSRTSSTRDTTINLRISTKKRALIDRAAEELGRSRSDFMLEASCREAESVLLDKVYFSVSAEEYKKFLALLESPPARNPGLKALISRPAPWDK